MARLTVVLCSFAVVSAPLVLAGCPQEPLTCGPSRECPTGYRCVSETRTCVETCWPVCASGEECISTKCYPRSCAGQGCLQDQVCASGTCVDIACLDVSCSPGQSCKAGGCYPMTCPSQACTARELCIGSVCQSANCAGVTCDPGRVCADGMCFPMDCGSHRCVEPEVCVTSSCMDPRCVGVPCGLAPNSICKAGVCEPCPAGSQAWGSRCITCPQGTVLEDGQCVPTCVPACGDGYGCALHSECFPTACSTGPCLGFQFCKDDRCATEDCLHVTCAPGETCRQGKCAVIQCGDIECRYGQICSQGACIDEPCVGVACADPTSYCADGRCLSCLFGPEGVCNDGRDDDCDKASDCADQDCAGMNCALTGVCEGGTCRNGCFVDGTFLAAKGSPAAAPCKVCDPTRATWTLFDRPDGTPCGSGQCRAGKCE